MAMAQKIGVEQCLLSSAARTSVPALVSSSSRVL
jgi:hypothetical protein